MTACSPHKPKEPHTLLAGLARWQVWLGAIIAVAIIWALLSLWLGTAHADSTTATRTPTTTAMPNKGFVISNLNTNLTIKADSAARTFTVTSTGIEGVSVLGYPAPFGSGLSWSFSSTGLVPGRSIDVAVQANANTQPGKYSGEAEILVYPSRERYKVSSLTITVESPSTLTALVPPGQFVELIREADERLGGIGQFARAGRLFPDRTFRDRIIIKNEMAVAANNAAIMGYWSTPTLFFRGWSGDGWELESLPDTERYIAKYLNPIPAGEAVELAIEFRVKDASVWRHLRNPQAEHAIIYNVLYPEGTVTRRGHRLLYGEEKVLSSLVPLEANFAYGWGTAPGKFLYHRHDLRSRSERTMLTASLHSPYTVQSFDADLPSTHAHFNEASGQACETKVHPEIRAGEVTLYQGWCSIGQFSHYPFLREGIKGNRLNSPGAGPLLWTLLGVPEPNNPSSLWYSWQASAEPGGQSLVVEVWSSRVITTVKIPRGQTLELTVQGPLEPTYRSYTIWNDRDGWWWKQGKASAADGEPMWSLWNLNTLTLHKDGRAEYTELPFRRPPS